ncbi:hypothetical protein SAMD00019534_081890 [Acytostelium subglobosum LB1]|uniref:hypothetical protein n=1 Tax=Acytostelium subglobosum LB1 TaxID=1410327 RepID=UPI0006451975|nr:hypothetical protein SAMD00019534_081890 [Acytostelium subglobosum LB1]GAM25014.1 hypothetical protein SAMD00019534_081890 [Acytostelium subglobosum LB1]|eukprot:XP_012752103.1 hypothetical protein SAMD00019534_081890 [Acytostelium subglobosum LB1]
MSSSNLSTAPLEDPSINIKKELTENGEIIVTELGKSIKSLIKHSNVHENMITICKVFAQHELNVSQTEEMINQMNALSKELGNQINMLNTSLQTLDGFNSSIVDINRTAHSFTQKTNNS